MANHGARHGTRALHDEELRDVDQRRKPTTHQDHQPSRHWDVGQHGDAVHDGDSKDKHHAGDRGLVEEQLRRRHLEFLVVGADENSVGSRGAHSREREEDSDAAGGLHLVTCGWLDVVVAGDSHACTYGDENESRHTWDGLLVEDIVDHGRHGREQDPAQLIDSDRGECQ